MDDEGLPPGRTAQALLRDAETAAWVRELAGAPQPPREVRLPGGADLAETLLDLAMAHEDVNPVLAAREQLAADAALTWLLETCVRLLVRDMGVPGGGPGGGPRLGPRLPVLPAETGPAGHWFPALVFAAAMPHTLAYHRAHGIPPEVSRRAFADVGRQCAVHRRRYGRPGVANPHWLVRHFRGTLFHLGRLQYERARLGGHTGRAVAAAGGPAGPGDLALGVHIPDFSGPLTPAACDDSVARARAFFPRHFPDEPYTVATCHSWLLDPQLAGHLPAGSNIVRFQARFRPVHVPQAPSHPDPRSQPQSQSQPPARFPDDRAPVAFVFGDPDLPIDALPRRTALERAIADHLRSGGHWYGGAGWFALATSQDGAC